MKTTRIVALVTLVLVVAGSRAGAQAPTVKIGYFPSDSFAVLYLLADRYLKKARSHVVDPNLELDASLLDSMQKLNADLGYLKYAEFLSADKLFTVGYRDRALRELGRQ